MKKPAALISTIFIALIALGHLLRILLNIDLIVAGINVPLLLSGTASVFCAFLAAWLYRERAN